ncbi:hypothetical protein V8C86DRAFT_2734538 [Haematococcus lacustris]
MAVSQPPINPLACHLCARSFKTMQGLEQHLRDVHSARAAPTSPLALSEQPCLISPASAPSGLAQPDAALQPAASSSTAAEGWPAPASAATPPANPWPCPHCLRSFHTAQAQAAHQQASHPAGTSASQPLPQCALPEQPRPWLPSVQASHLSGVQTAVCSQPVSPALARGDPLRCPQCPRSYSTAQGLQDHLQFYHHVRVGGAATAVGGGPPVGNPNQCSDCGRSFKTEQGRQEHWRVAHGTL